MNRGRCEDVRGGSLERRQREHDRIVVGGRRRRRHRRVGHKVDVGGEHVSQPPGGVVQNDDLLVCLRGECGARRKPCRHDD